MPDANTADLALVLSIVGLSVSVGGFLWALALYRLSGARVDVRLVPAILDDQGSIGRGPERGWSALNERDYMPKSGLGRWSIDLAEVRVTNVGRSAISVSNISLDLGQIGPWWKRWSRHTMQPRRVMAHDSIDADPVRLEPGSSVFVLFDVFAAVSSKWVQASGDTVDVRGSAHPVGRRVRRSKWRRRWQIGPTVRRLGPSHDPVDELEAYRVLWFWVRDYRRPIPSAEHPIHPTVESIMFVWWPVREVLRSGGGADEVAGALATDFDEWSVKLVAREIVAAYEDRPEPSPERELTQLRPKADPSDADA